MQNFYPVQQSVLFPAVLLQCPAQYQRKSGFHQTRLSRRLGTTDTRSLPDASGADHRIGQTGLTGQELVTSQRVMARVIGAKLRVENAV